MSHFSPQFISFFKNLSKNNSSEWFNGNRKIYEKEVKEPFRSFVAEMIRRIQKHEPEVKIKPADAITRINKDIRFSKDQTPYNTHVGAIISAKGKKDKSYPGMYIQLSHERATVFGGAYFLEPAALQKVRKYISENQKEFAAAYSDKKFKDKFGALQGDKNKRLPEEFVRAAEKEPLIANKQFYFSSDIKADAILKDDFTDTLMEYYAAGKKMNEFLKKAMK